MSDCTESSSIVTVTPLETIISGTLYELVISSRKADDAYCANEGLRWMGMYNEVADSILKVKFYEGATMKYFATGKLWNFQGIT